MNARLSRLMRHDRRWANSGDGAHRWDVYALVGCVVFFVALLVIGVVR